MSIVCRAPESPAQLANDTAVRKEKPPARGITAATRFTSNVNLRRTIDDVIIAQMNLPKRLWES